MTLLTRLSLLLALTAAPVAAQESPPALEPVPVAPTLAAPPPPAAATTPAPPAAAQRPAAQPRTPTPPRNATAAPAPVAAPPAPQPPIAGAEAARLRDLLRDDARRAELLRTLDALAIAGGAAPAAAAATAGAAATPAAPATPATPEADTAASPLPDILAPNTLGAQLLLGASQRLQSLSDQIVTAVQALTDLPSVVAWISGLARDPVTQARVLDASWKLGLLFGLGLLAEALAERWMRRWRDRLDRAAPDSGASWSWLRRVPLVLGRLVLDLLPVGAFAVVSYGLIGAVNPLPTTQLILLGCNNAYILARAVLITARMLFSPASAHLRLVPCADETAAYVTVWLRRIVAVGVVGFSVAETGLLFGLPWSAYDAIMRLVLLLVSLFLGIVVLQNRVAVADVLRAPPLGPTEAPDRGRRLLRALRNRLAEVWHIVAILYVVALWGVWALEVRDGFERLLHVSLATVAVVAAAKILDEGLRRALIRGFRVGDDLAQRYPGLEARANRYLPVLKGVISTVITFLAVLLLLESWGVESFAWFKRGALGSRLVGSLVQMGFVLLIAVAVWETANAAIARHLERLSRDAQAAKSARVRTLLPMLRTALLVVILTFVSLNLLTEIGVNVAPLIAGAGVIGLAVGFGSQKLVQDVITGIFLLFEDAVAVGDSVQLGGMSGTVEQLSIRSIRLRALDGSVHIVPFSAVTTVTNQSRDFGFAVMDVSVTYAEDTDRVAEALRGVAEDMRTDAKYRPMIRDALDVMGVDKLNDTGVVMRVRLKTEPAARWAVGREFNRRMKIRFAELGIEHPSQTQTLMVNSSPLPAKT